MGSFSSGITHCASRLRAFHRAHQALYTHHLLESTDSDWGICEVNLMPGNDRVLIENLKKQQLLYTVAEKGAESTELKIIGSMKKRCTRKSTAAKVFSTRWRVRKRRLSL